jgi:hypothetical protein
VRQAREAHSLRRHRSLLLCYLLAHLLARAPLRRLLGSSHSAACSAAHSFLSVRARRGPACCSPRGQPFSRRLYWHALLRGADHCGVSFSRGGGRGPPTPHNDGVANSWNRPRGWVAGLAPRACGGLNMVQTALGCRKVQVKVCGWDDGAAGGGGGRRARSHAGNAARAFFSAVGAAAVWGVLQAMYKRSFTPPSAPPS